MKKRDANLSARFRALMTRALGCSSRKGQSGQVLVMVAVLLIGLLAAMALVLDGGNVYMERRAMQNAADAGALAGARAVCTSAMEGRDPVAEAQAYASANGAGTAQVTVNAPRVTVVACKDVRMKFGKFIGVWWITVCGRAAAACVPVASWENIAPLAILWQNFSVGQCIDIWDSDVEYQGQTGNSRGWLNVECYSDAPCCCGQSNTPLKDFITGKEQGGEIKIPSYFFGDNGTVASAIMAFEPGKEYRVPVYDAMVPSLQNKAYYHVVTLGLFKVTGTYFNQGTKGVRGCFVSWFGSEKPGNEGDPDLGVHTVKLVE